MAVMEHLEEYQFTEKGIQRLAFTGCRGQYSGAPVNMAPVTEKTTDELNE